MSKAIELADYLRDKYCSTSNVKYSHAEQELRRLDAENAALRGESENKSKLIKLCLQTADAELIKQKGQINYLVRERDALRAQLAPVDSDVLAAANKLVLKAGYPSGTNLADALYELAEQQSPAAPEGYQLVPALAADWPLEVGAKRLLRELSLHSAPRDVVYFTLIDMLAAVKDT